MFNPVAFVRLEVSPSRMRLLLTAMPASDSVALPKPASAIPLLTSTNPRWAGPELGSLPPCASTALGKGLT